MPSARYHHAVTVDRSPGPLWEAMQEPSAWIGVGPIEHVRDPAFTEEGYLDRYRWDASIGGRRWEGTARTKHPEPGRKMEIHLDSTELRAVVVADLAPAGTGTAMDITIAAESRGMLATLFWGVVDQAIKSSIAGQVEGFAERLADA